MTIQAKPGLEIAVLEGTKRVPPSVMWLHHSGIRQGTLPAWRCEPTLLPLPFCSAVGEAIKGDAVTASPWSHAGNPATVDNFRYFQPQSACPPGKKPVIFMRWAAGHVEGSWKGTA